MRRMCTAGFKNRDVFLALADGFRELTKRLSRVATYLKMTPVSNLEQTPLISALVDIILFCGRVTK